MALCPYFPKDRKLDALCQKIKKHKFCQIWVSCLVQYNPDWMTKTLGGKVTEELLLEIINLAKENKHLRVILPAIIDCMDEDCLTDRVFSSLIQFPVKEVKASLIVCLCHKKLSEDQLIVLCELGTQFECFFELAQRYYVDCACPTEKFQMICYSFRKSVFSDMYDAFLEEFLSINTNDIAKQKWVEAQINEYAKDV